MDPWKMCAFGLAHVLGWGVVVAAVAQLRLLKRARTWPSVPGVISRSTTRRESGYTLPDIEFLYAAEEREYAGKRPILAGLVAPSWSSRAAERVATRYPEGAKVSVRFDPNDPSRACLEVGEDMPSLFVVAVAAIFIVVGAYGVVAGWNGW